jgi:hypothetical protein
MSLNAISQTCRQRFSSVNFQYFIFYFQYFQERKEQKRTKFCCLPRRSHSPVARSPYPRSTLHTARTAHSTHSTQHAQPSSLQHTARSTQHTHSHSQGSGGSSSDLGIVLRVPALRLRLGRYGNLIWYEPCITVLCSRCVRGRVVVSTSPGFYIKLIQVNHKHVKHLFSLVGA